MLRRAASLLRAAPLARAASLAPRVQSRAMGVAFRLPQARVIRRYIVAEKNLLKIFLSNKNVELQVVNNKSGHMVATASTREKLIRGTLENRSDRGAAKAMAELLAERLHAAGLKHVTWERFYKATRTGEFMKTQYTGKRAVVVDALREKGIEFVQHAKAKKATGMSWSARREAERAPAAAAEVFVHTKPWRTLTELKREAMAQRPWKGAKLRGAAAVAAAEAEAKT